MCGCMLRLLMYCLSWTRPRIGLWEEQRKCAYGNTRLLCKHCNLFHWLQSSLPEWQSVERRIDALVEYYQVCTCISVAFLYAFLYACTCTRSRKPSLTITPTQVARDMVVVDSEAFFAARFDWSHVQHKQHFTSPHLTQTGRQ
jgi:hypothetical protein